MPLLTLGGFARRFLAPSNAARAILAIDVGANKCGVALCDFETLKFVELATIRRNPHLRGAGPEAANQSMIDQITRLATRHQAGGLVVGWPVTHDGQLTERCVETARFLVQLQRSSGLDLPLVLADEYGTTVSAREALRTPGRRLGEGARTKVDQVAARLFLEPFVAELKNVEAFFIEKELEERRAKRGIHDHPVTPSHPVDLPASTLLGFARPTSAGDSLASVMDERAMERGWKARAERRGLQFRSASDRRRHQLNLLRDRIAALVPRAPPADDWLARSARVDSDRLAALGLDSDEEALLASTAVRRDSDRRERPVLGPKGVGEDEGGEDEEEEGEDERNDVADGGGDVAAMRRRWGAERRALAAAAAVRRDLRRAIDPVADPSVLAEGEVAAEVRANPRLFAMAHGSLSADDGRGGAPATGASRRRRRIDPLRVIDAPVEGGLGRGEERRDERSDERGHERGHEHGDERSDEGTRNDRGGGSARTASAPTTHGGFARVAADESLPENAEPAEVDPPAGPTRGRARRTRARPTRPAALEAER